MSPEFATSNLSKIKTKFRTSGAVSAPRRRAGSPLKEIGETNVKTVKCVTQDDYLNRLQEALTKTTDSKLKTFISQEIRKILIQRGQWGQMTR